jgi:hypothetical protein
VSFEGGSDIVAGNSAVGQLLLELNPKRVFAWVRALWMLFVDPQYGGA